MTFGEQNSLPESFRLLGGALEAGINFFDSAEMYPVVQRAETQGRSEEYLGRWIRESKIPRNSVVLATKVVDKALVLTIHANGVIMLDFFWFLMWERCVDAGYGTVWADDLDSRWPQVFGCQEYRRRH